MDWDCCVICGGGGDLKCPADSFQGNGQAVYSSFLEAVEEFKDLQCLPTKVQFSDHEDSESFLVNKAKWHKACHLKFANSKLQRVKDQRSKKRKLGVDDEEEQRKSKRRSVGGTSVEGCIFCSEVCGKLHSCSTMNLDHELRRMARELQDTSLLARIGGGDLIAIEAKYHFNCLSAYRNKYRSSQRARKDCTVDNDSNIIKANVLVELISYIEENVESGQFIFKLSELHTLYVGRLKSFKIERQINKTRLKQQLLSHFSQICQEQSDGKATLLVFNEGLKKMLKEAAEDEQNYESEILALVKVANKLRKELKEWKPPQFSGSFPPDCQNRSVPTLLKFFVSFLLNGCSMKTENPVESQAVLSISQLVYFNIKGGKASRNLYHCKECEPPLPLYVGLSIHTNSRSKKSVDSMYRMGLSVSYDRVLEVEKSLAAAVCKHFENEKLVCPASLRKGLFTVGALDNIDHNPSATTSQGAFHGTAISIFQFPTPTNCGITRDSLVIDPSESCRLSLPESYANVPSVSCKMDQITVSKCEFITDEAPNCLESGKSDEAKWIEHAMQLLVKDELATTEYVSWSAFHACLSSPVNPPAIIAMLPLFYEKAASIAMVKHGMDVQRSIVNYLNPGQIPVTAFDQPLFALAKFVQWHWPEMYGEQHYVVMFGGLHIEMALWKTIGDLLEGSGWTTALCEADVASSGRADSFLKASHLTKTRHSHQVTALALSKLQYEAWASKSSQEDISFQSWKQTMIKQSPTFHYWSIILEFEILVLILIRAHRQNSFDLYVESLEALAPWFFALDHVNYARWIPIHIRDMKCLPPGVKEQLKEFWVIQKTHNSFSSMPIDQAHEQNNAVLKDSGGVVGLTENPSAFQRWMIAGPEQARLLTEFESQLIEPVAQKNAHHEQSPFIQTTFKKQVSSLSEVISNLGNPFKDDCPELLTLDTRNCASEDVTSTVRTIESLGSTQYEQYVKDVIQDRIVKIQEPLKRNSLPLFKRPLPKKSVKLKQQVASLKSDCNLFSHLYIASKFREGNLEDFFAHENQPWPPSLSEHGKLRLPTSKSDLLTCIEVTSDGQPPTSYDVKLIDGPAIIHSLPTSAVNTFDQYYTDVFLPWTAQMLRNCDRIDIVWDVYKPSSLKESTRQKRGKGIRRKVSSQAKLPANFLDFLRDVKNKEELFSFLTSKVSNHDYPSGKVVHITSGSSVICRGSQQIMPDCDHEEADTRICVHLKDALDKGARTAYIRTVDTDVIVIVVGAFFELHRIYLGVDIWVAFGMGKHFRYYHINSICKSLGEGICRGLPFYHSFTGCDTTSQFVGKGKKSSWGAWKSFSAATEAFQYAVDHPFRSLDLESPAFELLEQFTCILYDKTTSTCKVNDLRQELFSQKAKLMENIPPTQAALIQHANRALYQACIWTTCLMTQQNCPSPEGFGWTLQDEVWKPVWTDLPEVAKACQELLKCGCKAPPLCSRRCKCREAGLSCTALCYCGGNCDH